MAPVGDHYPGGRVDQKVDKRQQAAAITKAGGVLVGVHQEFELLGALGRVAREVHGGASPFTDKPPKPPKTSDTSHGDACVRRGGNMRRGGKEPHEGGEGAAAPNWPPKAPLRPDG